MRVAIVHEYLTHFGGAERVLSALMELFPHAPVFTLVYDRQGIRFPFDERRIKTSWLQTFPGARRHHRYFPLLMPLAVEQWDFSQYDLVFSATHSFGKGVITGAHTLHISYCFTPTRYIWDDSHKYVREFSRSSLFQRFAPPALSYIRLWDYYASQRVNTYLTLSDYVGRRIRKYYGREALVLPPPVEVQKFTVSSTDEGYYLVVSRLVPYKRIDLAIEACEKLGRKLKVAGVGPEIEELKKKAGKWTEFLGFVDEADLPALYGGAKALLFPQEEDFGITTLEAAAAGKPTIAYRAGGALETIIDGVTGLFFDTQTADSLLAAIVAFEGRKFDAWAIRHHAEKYSRENFLQRLAAIVQQQWADFSAAHKCTLSIKTPA